MLRCGLLIREGILRRRKCGSLRWFWGLLVVEIDLEAKGLIVVTGRLISQSAIEFAAQ